MSWLVMFIIILRTSTDIIINKSAEMTNEIFDKIFSKLIHAKKTFSLCRYQFPKNFKFGVGTSAYQIEGAYGADGKGESIWDRFTHAHPEKVLNQQTGDVACNSYYLYRRDAQLMRNMGFHVYRFSISWTRILPNGDMSRINRAGLRHYHRVIDNLLANGIQPMISIYHWDLPQKIQEKGGWMNSETIDHITNFADILFEEYGHKVKWWITINEPLQIISGYGGSYTFAPGTNYSTPADYNVAHNLIKAHAAMYRLYDLKYRPIQNGKISLAIAMSFCEAPSDTDADKEAAERYNQFDVGWYAHPIYSKHGDYPPLMRKIVDENSKMEGRQQSRLPYFTEKEKYYIRGTFDFFGVNMYSTYTCIPGTPPSSGTYVNKDTNATALSNSRARGSYSGYWINVLPGGFRKAFNWLKEQYGNLPVYVTENGFADFGEINDVNRISYYQNYLKQMWMAMKYDNCNIIGHTVWSFMDNFEWTLGYNARFGIVKVDFNSSNRKRTPKRSAYYWRKILKTYCLPEYY